uniref:DOMON domain-containing protein n=1 Tax=Romanomermis culicivorax TaxID=13658 RepID=A0A915HKD5_ROMCU
MYDFRGFVEIRDAYSTGYAEPTIDPQQDVQALGFNYTGAVVRAVFRRAVDTGDSKDVVLQDAGLSQCQYFVFPTSGGEIVPYTNQRFHLKQHDEKPVVKLVCDLRKCIAKC